MRFSRRAPRSAGIAFAILMGMKIRQKAMWGSWCLVAGLALSPSSARAQDPPVSQPPQPPPAAQQPPQTPAPPEPQTSDPDVRVDALQPDFNLSALPTTLRLPARKFSFRVTHRFNRSLGQGDLGDLVNDFFGFDSGAQIGLELRYGLRPGTQIGVYRTSDRTIEIFGQQNVWQQKPDGRPLGIDVIATLEGTNNLRDQKSPAIGLLVSRKIAKVAAIYAEPIFVANTNPLDTGDNNTTMIGLGGRLRIRPRVYLVGEVTPRLAGYKPGTDQGSFGLEMRAGGHTFQINFSNGLGTTLGQLARGGVSSDSWFIGFNISRKFF
jgi:hypothetical protein